MATIIDSNGTPTSESSALSVIDVTLDIRQNRMVSVLLKQYNKQSQQIKFTVTDNGKKIELKEIEHTVLFKMMTPDGRRVSSYCAINENDHTAVLTVAKNYCSYPGKGTAELEVMDALEESQVGTMNLDVVIENSAYPDEMINGSSTYQGLDEKINAVREACNSAITAKEETETIRDECDGIRNTCNDLKEEAQQYKNEAMSYANGESGTRYGEETDNAKYFYELSLQKEKECEHNLTMTESYVHGGTGVREDEDADNAEYYYNQTSSLKADTEAIKVELLEVQEDVNQKASSAETSAANASNSASEAEKSASQASADRETVTALANEVNNKIGSPLTASASSDMVNQNKIYVYTGSEDGYTFGNWYYHDGSSWVSGGIYNSTAFKTDSTLTYEGEAADSKATGDALDLLKGDLVNLQDGKDTTIITYYDELGNGIGGNIYKSNKVLIPAKTVITSIRYYSKSVGTSAVLFILDSNDKIVGRYEQTSYEVGWNTFELNTSFDFDCYIAISGGTVRFSYSNSEKENMYSNGLFECPSTDRNKLVNDTLSFTQNMPSRYYEFSVEVNYHTNGISYHNDLVDTRLSKLETSALISDYVFPKVTKTSEEGYTLLGRWYKFSTFNECVNSAGASIMFNVKNATSVMVDIEQVVHPSHADWRMTVEPYFAYSIDGSDWVRVQIGTEAKTINLPNTDNHIVWIVIDGMCLNSGSANRNSGWSAVYIKSLTTDGKMYKVKPKNRQILFVGDSIVEGINTLGTTNTSEANSTVNEFSFKTGRKLNAIPLIQGYGGSASWTGTKYERYSLVDNQQDSFIVNNEVDAILIEYGYNDNTVISNGTKTKQDFINAYNELINLLVGKYGCVPIFCMIPFKQSLAKEIRQIASERSYCYCIETSDYDVTYSDNAHPNVNGAEEIANRLSADIEKVLGKDFFM